MELKLPVDFERLPEFRRLCEGLASRSKSAASAREIEAAATFIWMRLWVELAYEAQSTEPGINPGTLTIGGSKRFVQSIAHLFGDDERPMEILVNAGMLIARDFENHTLVEGWPTVPQPRYESKLEVSHYVSMRFSRHNQHLGANFVSRETKGAAASALERNKNRIAHEANQQAMLLAPEVFRVPVEWEKQPDGPVTATKMRALTDSEINRCMILIKTLDNCLRINNRKKGEYTEGLIADAWAAVDKHTPESLREFYIWLTTNREHPAVPKVTEQVLAKFEEVFGMKG